MRPIAGLRSAPAALTAVLAFSVCAAISPDLHARTWCVQTSGPDCDEAGTSIQAAIHAAAPGDTIKVGAGTFVEGAVWIDRRLNLLGVQAGIDARGRSGAPGAESIISPTVVPHMPILVLGPGSAGSVIDGFTLAGGSLSIQNGLQPGESNDNLQIRNNRLVGFWAAGIALEAPGIDITIDQNHVDGSSVNHPDMLVSLRAPGAYHGLWLTNNTIVNGGVQAMGFSVMEPTAVVGRSETRTPIIRGNTISQSFGGVLIRGVFEDGEVSDNVIESNMAAGLDGVFVRSLIARNLLFGNAGPGIRFSSILPAGALATNQVQGNAIIGNQVGAYYDGGDTIDVAGNFWGAASGPYHAVRNPGGGGNGVVDQQVIGPGSGTGRLLFEPWLTTSPVPLPSTRTWCVPAEIAGCDLVSATIGGAVRSAWPGDTVKVAAGTYVEGLWINKPLALRGAQAGVDARGRSGAESIVTVSDPMAPVIVLGPGAAGTVIDGFTLLDGDLGIQNDDRTVSSIGGLQVLNNRITGFWAAGIALSYPGEDITIDRNFVDGWNVNHPDMLVSLRAEGSYRGFWLTNNEIVRGGTQAVGFSVHSASALVAPSARRTPLIKGNTFSSNLVGVQLVGLFENGEVSDNAFIGSLGNGLQGALRSTLFAHNMLEANAGVGVSLVSVSGDNEIADNNFLGNERGGLAAAPLTGSVVARNSFRSNGAGGPAMNIGGGGTQNTIVDNELRDNLSDGIYGGPVESFIGRNLVTGNRGFAIYLFSGARDNTITDNLLLENGQPDGCGTPGDPYGCGGGIALSTRSVAVVTNTISGNTIAGNRVGAVYAGPNGTSIRDLRSNDWGAASGPYHAVRNPAGAGNVVIDNSSVSPAPFAGMILFDPWIGTGYTPVGTNVDIDVPAALPDGTTTMVAVGFDQVHAAGRTVITTAETGPAPPMGFQVGHPPVFYEVATTATFSGYIEICFCWTEGQYHNEKAIRVFHYESGAWVDATSAVDTAGNHACGRVTALSPFALMEVAYQFSGLFPPVANPPTVNIVKAGQAVPVKFSLGGDHGLDIFDAGSPVSREVACGSDAGTGLSVAAVTAGSSGLRYSSTDDQYTYVWKTEPAWAHSCRELILEFKDGSSRTANFHFRQ